MMKKLSRNEMKNVNGGRIAMPIGCYVQCVDESTHPIAVPPVMVSDCQAGTTAAACFGMSPGACFCSPGGM
jgi:hypothetical protein